MRQVRSEKGWEGEQKNYNQITITVNIYLYTVITEDISNHSGVNKFKNNRLFYNFYD